MLRYTCLIPLVLLINDVSLPTLISLKMSESKMPQEFPKDPSSKEVLRMANVENAYPRWLGNKILFQSNRWSLADLYNERRRVGSKEYFQG